MGLHDGEYFVSASHPHAQRDTKRRTSVELESGKTARITVTMLPAGGLEGNVRGLAARREDKARMRHRIVYSRLDEEGGDDEEHRRDRARVQSIHVRPDGRFQQQAVTPGTYRLVLVSQAKEKGQFVAVGPTTGFSSSRPIGSETKRVLGDATIEAGRTTVLEFDVGAE